MNESITNRVGRIISGSVNAVVDAVENAAPELVMEESIREIDAAIDEVKAELGKVVANKHLANQRLAEENHIHENLAEKIELAVKEGRDDLAEVAISKQMDIEAQIPILEASIEDASSQETELDGYIAALNAKKREMREELIAYRESRKEAESLSASGNSSGGNNIESKVTKAESAFDRVVENATGVLGSRGSVDAKAAAQLSELDDIARNNKIRERLDAIKNESK